MLPAALSKEQQKALQIYFQYKDDFHSLIADSTLFTPDGPLLSTNFVAASWRPFEKLLPREYGWIWTQSNGKASIVIDEVTVVTLRKLNPRRRASISNEKPPSYKIWLFEVKIKGERSWYLVWCERGVDNGIKTEIGLVFPQKLTMEDFAFLYPFTDAQSAMEFGWL